MDTKKILKSPKSEHTINWIKAMLAVIPVIWWPLNSLMNDYLPNYKIKRIRKFIEELSEKFQKFESHLNEEYIKSEEFWYLFEEVMKKISYEYREEKLLAYKNFLLNSIIDTTIKGEKKEYFLSIIDKLSYYHLIILKIFYNPELIIQNKNIDIKIFNQSFWWSLRNVFLPLIKCYKIEEYLWMNAMQEVEQMWLISETLSSMNTMLSRADLDTLKQRQSIFWKEFYKFIWD